MQGKSICMLTAQYLILIYMTHNYTHALNTKNSKEWGKQINGLKEICTEPASKL